MSTRGYNCVVVGNLTADSELRTNSTGTPLLIFRIAGPRAHHSNGRPPDATPYCRALI